MSLIRRFALLIVTLSVSVLAVAVTGAMAVETSNQALHRTVERDMKRVLLVTDTRRLFRSMVVAEGSQLLEEDAKVRADLEASISKNRVAQLENFSRLEPLLVGDEDLTALTDLKGVAERFEARHRAVAVALERRDAAAAKRAAAEHLLDPVSWEKTIAGLIERSNARLDAEVASHQLAKERSFLIIVGVTVASTFFAFIVGALVFRGIRRNVRFVETTNANLEGLVAARTDALAKREHAMRMVLDNTGDGLVVVDRTGTLLPERSAAIHAWFPNAGQEPLKLWELLHPHDPSGSLGLEIGFEQLIEEFLPFAVAAEQIPSRIDAGGRHLELAFREIREGDRLARVLCVIKDATAQVERERMEADTAEQHAVLRNLVHDRRSFMAGVAECQALIDEIAGGKDPSRVRRALHTLKGNTAILGFSSVSRACDELETTMAELGVLPAAGFVGVAEAFRRRLSQIEDFIGPRRARHILEIDERQHQELVRRLENEDGYRQILAMVERWKWVPMAETLSRLGAQASHLGVRMNKPIDVELEHGSICIPPGRLDRFLGSLVHVLRNAVDHGIESEEERIANGKPARGKLRFVSRLDHGELVLSVRDDGRGIDPDQLVLAARNKGIVVTREAWAEALFADGVSTREETTEYSGRGVGMAAVRAACIEIGGRVEVETKLGEGTAFVFTFPCSWDHPGALAA